MACMLRLQAAAQAGVEALSRSGDPPGQREEAVLLEQLDYLIGHARTCTDGCPQCLRFGRIRILLMEVWR
jgi:hypothetical protein